MEQGTIYQPDLVGDAADEVGLRRCTRCVMDTTDPNIRFDDEGICNHCSAFDANNDSHVFGGEEGKLKLDALVATLKREGKGRRYDCVIGLSGGVDSTYVAWKVRELGLRALAVHLDNGWDSELAVKNIQNAVQRLGIDLQTVVLDWEEFRDIQVAFLCASTPDSEIPSDHAIAAVMAQKAAEHGVRLVSGFNHRTESHLPVAWSAGHLDWRYIKSVHGQFGKKPLRTFPHIGYFKAREFTTGATRIDLLDYIDYSREDAKEILIRELGWQDYGGKHHESIYTRFYQGYLLPKKFGFDKRKTHLSSLICSGQITRDEALAELQTGTYSPESQKSDREYVIKKLQLSDAEFEAIMRKPKRTFFDFPSYHRIKLGASYKWARSVYRGFVKPAHA